VREEHVICSFRQRTTARGRRRDRACPPSSRHRARRGLPSPAGEPAVVVFTCADLHGAGHKLRCPDTVPDALPGPGPTGDRNAGGRPDSRPAPGDAAPCPATGTNRATTRGPVPAGADPRPFFRFPFGERDARTIAAVNDLGYVAVRWTVDTLGWKGTSGGISTQTVTDRVLAGLQPGEIVLMHIGSNPDDGSTLDADALPLMIDRIRAAGYGFVTPDVLLGG
jgi:hypothetical protein